METEVRLINANAVRSKIIALATGYHSEMISVYDVIRMIDAEDSVEAVPVSNARWVVNEADSGKLYKNGNLEDKKIEAALRKAADDYENGELIEVRDLLLEIINAIDEFTKSEENS